MTRSESEFLFLWAPRERRLHRCRRHAPASRLCHRLANFWVSGAGPASGAGSSHRADRDLARQRFLPRLWGISPGLFALKEGDGQQTGFQVWRRTGPSPPSPRFRFALAPCDFVEHFPAPFFFCPVAALQARAFLQRPSRRLSRFIPPHALNFVLLRQRYELAPDFVEQAGWQHSVCKSSRLSRQRR